MPIHDFTRPDYPYDNNKLRNSSHFKIITDTEKRPVAVEEIEDELNSHQDQIRALDEDIQNIEAGIIPGSDDPNNALKFFTTDGEGNQFFTKVTNAYVNDNSLSGNKVSDGTINIEKLADGLTLGDKVPDESFPWVKIQVGDEEIPYAKLDIADGAIPYAKLDIADGAIPYAKLTVPDNTVPGSKIGNKSITQAQQGLLSVGTPELIDQSVTVGKIAPNVLPASATKEDQIAASSATVFTNPLNQQHHPTSPKFRCSFNGSTVGTNPPLSGYGVTTVQRISTGVCKVNFSVLFTSAVWEPFLSCAPDGDSGDPIIPNILELGINYVIVTTKKYNGALFDSSLVCVMGFGAQ